MQNNAVKCTQQPVEEKTKSQKEQVPAAMLVEAAPVKREV
jgi:hypothetical protein